MNAEKPLVSILFCAYNEEAVIEHTLVEVDKFIAERPDYRWEVVVVNDGSKDRTIELAQAHAADKENYVVVTYAKNGGLGHATRKGIEATSGDFVITLDIDLSYSLEHVDWLLAELESTHAQVVLASPYMKGGQLKSVPKVRAFFSIAANRFLSLFAHGNLSTITGMARGYRGEFVRGLYFSSEHMDSLPEMVYKSMVLKGDIRQIPATLDWTHQLQFQNRRSSMRVLIQIMGTLLSGFMFRPFFFFVLPGLFLLAFSLYTNVWTVIHAVEAFVAIGQAGGDATISEAIAKAYANYPHTFIVGLLSLMVAIQLVTLGIVSLQQKQYFDELFRLISFGIKKGSKQV